MALVKSFMADRFHYLALLAIFFAGVRGEARPNVWVTPALARVGPEAAANGVAQIVLWAGRGEYESFQVTVRGPAGGLEGGQFRLRGSQGRRGEAFPGKIYSFIASNTCTLGAGVLIGAGATGRWGPAGIRTH
jgi:hypothetical protein